MSIKTRRERERQEVRQAILSAAREIAAEAGWQAVTIRKVAERIEWSPPTIYEHFASKELILVELMRQGFRELLESLGAARAVDGDPMAALLRMARAYWDWAFRNPELYQVMHGLGGVAFHGLDALDGQAHPKIAEAENAFLILVAALQDLVHNRNARIDRLEDTAEIVWATVHGLIALCMAGRLEDGPAHAQQLVEQAMHQFFIAWGVEPAC